MVAIVGGIAAALAWTVTTVAASQGSRRLDSRSLLATVMTVGLLVAAPAAIISGVPAGLDAGSIVWLVAAGAGNVGGLLLAYPAFRIGALGFVAPIIATEGAFAAAIAILAGEHVGGAAVVSLIVIAAGVVLATASWGDRTRQGLDVRAALLASASAVSFGVALYATARIGNTLGIAWAVLPPRVVGVAVIAIPLALRRRWHMNRSALPYAIVGGVFEVVGFVCYTVGARHSVAISAVLSCQFAALSALVGYLFFHERLRRLQVAGLVTIICGVTTLAALQG